MIGSIQALEKYAKLKEQERFSKEAMYKADNLRKRIIDSNETLDNFDSSLEGLKSLAIFGEKLRRGSVSSCFLWGVARLSHSRNSLFSGEYMKLLTLIIGILIMAQNSMAAKMLDAASYAVRNSDFDKKLIRAG